MQSIYSDMSGSHMNDGSGVTHIEDDQGAAEEDICVQRRSN